MKFTKLQCGHWAPAALEGQLCAVLATVVGYMAHFHRGKRRRIPFRNFHARRACKGFYGAPIRTSCGTDLGVSI